MDHLLTYVAAFRVPKNILLPREPVSSGVNKRFRKIMHEISFKTYLSWFWRYNLFRKMTLLLEKTFLIFKVYTFTSNFPIILWPINRFTLQINWPGSHGENIYLKCVSLTHSPKLSSYRNQSIVLQGKSIDWFLYDRNFRI